jgi:hypothetical protein
VTADIPTTLNATTFSGNVTLSSGSVAAAQFIAQAASGPDFLLYASGNATNQKYSRITDNGSGVIFDFLNDALSADSAYLVVTRSGYTATGASFNVPVSIQGQAALTDQGAWTAYTPTLSATSGTYGSGATVSGRYVQLGRLVCMTATVNTPNIGSAAGGAVITLPVAQRSGSTAIGQGRENAVNGKMLQVITDGANSVQILNYDNSSPIVAGAQYLVSFTYEAAAG